MTAGKISEKIETRVTFYAGVPHRGRFLHRLLETRILSRNLTALVLAGDEKSAEELDAFLWTCREESFLPHARVGDGWAASSPVLIAAGIPSGPERDSFGPGPETDSSGPEGNSFGPAGWAGDVLVDWSMTASDFPDFARRFRRLVDIVAADPESAGRGRERFRKFRDLGFAVDAHAIDKR